MKKLLFSLVIALVGLHQSFTRAIEPLTVQKDKAALNTALLAAAEKNDFKEVKRLINMGADVNQVDARGITPLLYAMSQDNVDVDMVKYLAENGADINQVEKSGETALSLATGAFAARANNSEMVRYLVAKGANVNHALSDGVTPLMQVSGNLALTKFLLEQGANANATTKAGETALTYAVGTGVNLEIVKLLFYFMNPKPTLTREQLNGMRSQAIKDFLSNPQYTQQEKAEYAEIEQKRKGVSAK